MRKVLIATITLSLALAWVACSTTWVSTLDSILAVAVPALTNILQIASQANDQPLNTNLDAKINADATAIRTLAADLAKASSESAQGVCQQLQAAVSAYQADQQLVMKVAQVGNPNIQTKIALLSDLLANTVNALVAVIPSCNLAMANLTVVQSYSLSRFSAQYNGILVAPTGNSVVDAATQKLKLHQHSKFVRSISFGHFQ